MGMFDTVSVFMKCPYCGKHQVFEFNQVEGIVVDPDVNCALDYYYTYEKDTLQSLTSARRNGRTSEGMSRGKRNERLGR